MGPCYNLWPAAGLRKCPHIFGSALLFLISVAALKEFIIFHVVIVTKWSKYGHRYMCKSQDQDTGPMRRRTEHTRQTSLWEGVLPGNWAWEGIFQAEETGWVKDSGEAVSHVWRLACPRKTQDKGNSPSGQTELERKEKKWVKAAWGVFNLLSLSGSLLIGFSFITEE